MLPIIEGSAKKGTVMKFEGSSPWKSLGDEADIGAGKLSDVSLAIYNNISYIAFSDNSVSGKLTMMKFDEVK